MDIEQFLAKKQVKFTKLRHPNTNSALRLAQAVRVPGQKVCKSVVVFADELPVLLVLPASKRVDFHQLSKELGTSNLRLASELRFKSLFPDCDTGALPPFGSHYDLRTLADESLPREEGQELLFEGNDHTTAYQIKARDYFTLENPELARFAA